MKEFNKNLNEKLKALITLIFSLGVLVPIVFLAGITVILITVYSLSITAFGFTLGGVLILLSFLLLQIN